MKKLFLVIVLCMITAVCFAGREKPQPEGKGVYLGTDTTVNDLDGYNNLNNEVGETVVQNLNCDSDDLREWAANGVNVNVNGKTVSFPGSGTKEVHKISHSDNPIEINRPLTYIGTFKLLTEEGTALTFKFQDIGNGNSVNGSFTVGDIAANGSLPKSTEVEIRLKSDTGFVDWANGGFGGVKFTISDNQTEAYSYVLTKSQLYYTIPDAIVNFGDSIARSMKKDMVDTAGQGSFPFLTYMRLYAAKYGLEFTEMASSGNTLNLIRAEVEAYDGKAPICIIEGGRNDIMVDGATSAEIITYTAQAIASARKKFNKIILIDIFPSPEMTGAYEVTRDAYNASVLASYGSDSQITLISTDSLSTALDSADFADDNIHVMDTGHVKVFNEIDKDFAIPDDVNRYDYTKTVAFPIVDASDLDVRHLTRTITADLTLTGNKIDETILIDASSATRVLTLSAAPIQGEKYTIICWDTDSDTNACTVGRNGKNIGGVAADLDLDESEVRVLQYDATVGWFYLVQTI